MKSLFQVDGKPFFSIGGQVNNSSSLADGGLWSVAERKRQCRQIGVCRDASQITCHCEPVRRLVVAISRLVGKCTEKFLEERESPRFLAVIITWFLSTGGLPHQCAHWFAMTGNLGRISTNNNLSFHVPGQALISMFRKSLGMGFPVRRSLMRSAIKYESSAKWSVT